MGTQVSYKKKSVLYLKKGHWNGYKYIVVEIVNFFFKLLNRVIFGGGSHVTVSPTFLLSFFSFFGGGGYSGRGKVNIAVKE